MDRIAQFLGYGLLILISIFIALYLAGTVWQLLKKWFRFSYLDWWINHKKNTNELKTSDNWMLLKRSSLFITDFAPRKFKKQLLHIIDIRMEELREEIRQQGEMPTF